MHKSIKEKYFCINQIMAKPVSEKSCKITKLKFEIQKLKEDYTYALNKVLVQNRDLKDKMDEMEKYYLDKIFIYKKEKEDILKENFNCKCIDLLRNQINLED